MTDDNTVKIPLPGLPQMDPEAEARLLLALAAAPDDLLMTAYASSSLQSEGPRLVAALITRIDEILGKTLPATGPLAADSLVAAPVGTVVRDRNDRFFLKTYHGWENLDWGAYSQDDILMAEDSPVPAGQLFVQGDV